MKTKRNIVVLLLLGILFFAACKKWKDNIPPADPRLTKHYCNDPAGVNYNWDFPGVPDNSVCFYPDQQFAGSYSLTDSVYFSDNSLDTFSITQRHFTIYSLGHTSLALVGFCGGTDTLKLTATKYYSATIDSTKTAADSLQWFAGQKFCNVKDTVTGTLVKFKADSLRTMMIDFTVIRDSASGIIYHRGTAIKQ